MFNRPQQLTRLILSFYREDQQLLRQLQPLNKCQLFRRWKILYVRCSDRATALALAEAHSALNEPVAQLGLAKQIAILVNNTPVTVLPVELQQVEV